MFKVDQLKSISDCDRCNNLLVDPIVMPCGNVICKKHLNEILNNISKEKNTFICGICLEEHQIPKNGFIVNNRLHKLTKFELNTLKLSPVFHECTKEIEDAKDNMFKVELLEQNAENYIYEYFEDIKRQVDIRREDLKLKIDEYSDEMIKSVELNQMNLIKLTKEVNQMTTVIEKSKNELKKLITQFDTLEINDKKFEDIKASVAVVNQEFHKILAEYHDSLIGNKKYTFELKELPIEDIFGRVMDCTHWDSAILDKQNKSAIKELCEFPLEKNWKLQYRATRDGFTGPNFHSKCDGIANTLTVIKSEHGNIFGGFTEKAWNSSGGFVADPKAFIFSLVNKENKPFKAVCTNSEHAIFCRPSCGPKFGRGDIRIMASSNSNRNSYSEFGNTYKHADYQKGTEKAKSILAGSLTFQILEIEVFVATN